MARTKTESADPRAVGALAGGDKGSGHPTLVAQLVVQIEEAILSGSLSAGERINADVFAEHYGISRIPVREALRTLEADGWIRSLARQGYFVREKSATEIYDLFETRLVLEPAAAALAAERRTPEDMEKLARIVEQARAGARAGDGARLALLNQEYHAALARAAGNSVLESLLTILGKRVRFYTALANSRRDQAIDEHELLNDAILRRDAAAAANIARDHILATRGAPEMPRALEAMPSPVG